MQIGDQHLGQGSVKAKSESSCRVTPVEVFAAQRHSCPLQQPRQEWELASPPPCPHPDLRGEGRWGWELFTRTGGLCQPATPLSSSCPNPGTRPIPRLNLESPLEPLTSSPLSGQRRTPRLLHVSVAPSLRGCPSGPRLTESSKPGEIAACHKEEAGQPPARGHVTGIKGLSVGACDCRLPGLLGGPLQVHVALWGGQRLGPAPSWASQDSAGQWSLGRLLPLNNLDPL